MKSLAELKYQKQISPQSYELNKHCLRGYIGLQNEKACQKDIRIEKDK